MNFGNFSPDVAPHGIIMVAAFMFLVIVALHLFGFRIVGALKVGR